MFDKGSDRNSLISQMKIKMSEFFSPLSQQSSIPSLHTVDAQNIVTESLIKAH